VIQIDSLLDQSGARPCFFNLRTTAGWAGGFRAPTPIAALSDRVAWLFAEFAFQVAIHF
jgi:hypothetical protein